MVYFLFRMLWHRQRVVACFVDFILLVVFQFFCMFRFYECFFCRDCFFFARTLYVRRKCESKHTQYTVEPSVISIHDLPLTFSYYPFVRHLHKTPLSSILYFVVDKSIISLVNRNDAMNLHKFSLE